MQRILKLRSLEKIHQRVRQFAALGALADRFVVLDEVRNATIVSDSLEVHAGLLVQADRDLLVELGRVAIFPCSRCTRLDSCHARHTRQRTGCSTFATGLSRNLKASGMPDPSNGRRYILNASVTSVPLAAMNSSSITRVLPATASSGSNS